MWGLLWGRYASEREAQLAAVDKSMAIIEFTPDGTILNANENFLKAVGYQLDEIRGKHHSIFVESTTRSSPDYHRFWERLARGEYQVAQYKRIGKGGKEIWIEASYNPILDRDRRVIKVVKYATDVTRQKKEHADLLGLVSAIQKSQAVIEFDMDGIILSANDKFLNAFGYVAEEIIGKHHSMFVVEADRGSAAYQAFWEKLRTGEYQAAQYKRIGKGGREIWVEATYTPILDLNGKPHRVVKYATDVTQQVLLLARLKTLIDTNFREVETALKAASDQTAHASSASDSTLVNVQTVAAGSEQLAASISEISESMVRSRDATEEAFGRAEAADISTQKLNRAAKAMTGIVDLIRRIAGQINLLALNATIEAARAGSAGKGFAVVATEVKNLANQAANATSQISQEIEGVQTICEDVAGALGEIRSSIEIVREHVAGTAGAVEEQSAVTSDMTERMNSASASVQSVTVSIDGIIAAVQQVTETIQNTKEAAQVLAR